MSEQQVIATWIAFTITALRKATGWSLERFLKEDEKAGIIRFLEENYDLHHFGSVEEAAADALRYAEGKVVGA